VKPDDFCPGIFCQLSMVWINATTPSSALKFVDNHTFRITLPYSMEHTTENQNIEVDLLLQAIYKKYGYDFKDYARLLSRWTDSICYGVNNWCDETDIDMSNVVDTGDLEILAEDWAE